MKENALLPLGVLFLLAHAHTNNFLIKISFSCATHFGEEGTAADCLIHFGMKKEWKLMRTDRWPRFWRFLGEGKSFSLYRKRFWWYSNHFNWCFFASGLKFSPSFHRKTCCKFQFTPFKLIKIDYENRRDPSKSCSIDNFPNPKLVFHVLFLSRRYENHPEGWPIKRWNLIKEDSAVKAP